MPVATAKRRAERLERRPWTRGRVDVRGILASWRDSKSMLRALAEEEERKVPVVRKRRVRGEREGDMVVVERRSGETG